MKLPETYDEAKEFVEIQIEEMIEQIQIIQQKIITIEDRMNNKFKEMI